MEEYQEAKQKGKIVLALIPIIIMLLGKLAMTMEEVPHTQVLERLQVLLTRTMIMQLAQPLIITITPVMITHTSLAPALLTTIKTITTLIMVALISPHQQPLTKHHTIMVVMITVDRQLRLTNLTILRLQLNRITIIKVLTLIRRSLILIQITLMIQRWMKITHQPTDLTFHE